MSSGNDIVQVARLDLTDAVSIRTFAATWLGPLHILVNNAGVMAIPELELSFEGHEKQFATNHLGHFGLTVAMHQALAAANGARVVCVSSNAHQFSPVVLSDVDFENREYDPWLAYGQSKTANVLHAVEITRRWADDGIVANALHPGAIPTRLQRYVGGLQTPEHLQKTVEQGAATSALLAGSPLVEGIGGRYFEDCNEAEVTSEPELFGGGVNPWALDPTSAQELWDLSLSMRSSRSSIPTLKRTRLAGGSSVEPAVDKWVITEGSSIKLSTPPSDSARVKTSVDSQTLRAASTPPFTVKLTMPPKSLICVRATSWPG
jgi:NAD(P)-dependent dehydrogenase (short-subunit alcohol dehydrogenase family)